MKLLKAEEKKQEKISIKKYWEDIKQDFKDKWNKFQSTFHLEKPEENKVGVGESGTSSDADRFAINKPPIKKNSAKKPTNGTFQSDFLGSKSKNKLKPHLYDIYAHEKKMGKIIY